MQWAPARDSGHKKLKLLKIAFVIEMKNHKMRVRFSSCNSTDKNAWNWFVTSNRPNWVCSTSANEFSLFFRRFSALNGKYVSKLWISSDCWTQKEPLTKIKFNKTYRRINKKSLQIAGPFYCFLLLISTLSFDTRRPNTMDTIILTAQFVHRSVAPIVVSHAFLFPTKL